jgi:general secretion pathway protein G
MKMQSVHGFTLVEVLVVVVVLGVLAAIVVPQFSSAAIEAQSSSLRRDLQVVRKQVELYRHHHNDDMPARAGETNDDFARRLTNPTDANGAPGPDHGPYLQRIPMNPFNKLDTVRIGGAEAGIGSHGWRFDPVTGEFQSDDDYDGNGDSTPDHIDF